MAKVWQSSGNSFFYNNKNSELNELETGVYLLKECKFGLFLDKQSETFILPSKLYDLNTPFINRVVTTWNKIDGNLGVLLSGMKGTSKSVTAKIICNQLQLPVVIVNTRFSSMPDFINEIQQELIIFFDEFEKVYDRDEDDNVSEVLSLLDGINTNVHKRLFLFTTNELRIDGNLLNRPGRVRYHKKFDRLPDSAIFEIVDDLLVYQEYKDDLLETIGKLSYLTIDAITSLINEVNMHKDLPSKLIEDMNLDYNEQHFLVTIQQILEDNKLAECLTLNEIVSADLLCKKSFRVNSNYDIGDSFIIEGCDYGDITKVLTTTKCVITEYGDEETGIPDKKFLVTVEPTAVNIFKHKIQLVY
jgi:SpoVK/Ycf46/Vps4 family AAA+-type ATPase